MVLITHLARFPVRTVMKAYWSCHLIIIKNPMAIGHFYSSMSRRAGFTSAGVKPVLRWHYAGTKTGVIPAKRWRNVTHETGAPTDRRVKNAGDPTYISHFIGIYCFGGEALFFYF